MQSEIKIGQVWNDEDKRRSGRFLLVEKILKDKVICSDGNKKVKIKINRFIPKYYSLKNDVYDQLSLIDRCHFKWKVDWKKIDQNIVGIDSGTLSVRLREIDSSCYDTKIIISSKWIYSSVIRKNLNETLEELLSIIINIKNDLNHVTDLI